jgi:hypothetical protein
VFNGAALVNLTAVDPLTCPGSLVSADALLSSVACTETELGDCEGSEFGAKVSIGDLDPDGEGELVVSAPRMKVRDIARAGAVLIYRVADPQAVSWADTLFVSSAEGDDQLGLALATPEVGDRAIIAAGAPGGGKVVLFYCNSLLPRALRGARCL